MAEADLRFWLEIPPSERAAAVWQLSVEAFRLADLEADERRLPRPEYRIIRR
jgi:hypothetical protein